MPSGCRCNDIHKLQCVAYSFCVDIVFTMSFLMCAERFVATKSRMNYFKQHRKSRSYTDIHTQLRIHAFQINYLTIIFYANRTSRMQRKNSVVDSITNKRNKVLFRYFIEPLTQHAYMEDSLYICPPKQNEILSDKSELCNIYIKRVQRTET